MVSDKPVITVVGSTSKQGYSVAKSLLATGDYTVRALTRNPEGECAPPLLPFASAQFCRPAWTLHDAAHRTRTAPTQVASTGWHCSCGNLPYLM